MNGHVIRPLDPADHPSCLALWSASEGIGDAPDHGRLAAFLARNPGFSQVAIADGAAVGVLLASFDGIRGYFYRLAVARAWRRQGVAQALVAAAAAALESAGVERVNLHVFADNAPARAFWASVGWTPYEGLETWRREF